LETKNTGGFEGVGEIGLKWLKKSKKETGLLMGPKLLMQLMKLALEYDIDVLDRPEQR
jgi:chorismate mutase